MTTDYKIIGATIKEYRIKRGLSQRELAIAVSRSESAIAKYEQGLVEIPLLTMNKIAAALHIELSDLVQQIDDEEIDISIIGQRIRSIRKEQGLTQQQMADIMGGVTQATVQQYETNSNPPKITTLIKIAKALNTTVDSIINPSAPLPIGAALQRKRKISGLTQQQVADFLGLKNKSTYASWEIGKSQPDILTFLLLCVLFRVPGTDAPIRDLNIDIEKESGLNACE